MLQVPSQRTPIAVQVRRAIGQKDLAAGGRRVGASGFDEFPQPGYQSRPILIAHQFQ
jgi:hypothetical protein